MDSPVQAAWIEGWARLWAVSDLQRTVRFEFSSRMRRSLGRCYPPTGLIRLNHRLLECPEALLREVVCHEVAHAAVYRIHGKRARPHGAEWKALMRQAGYEPRVRVPLDAMPKVIRSSAEPTKLYEHHCPVCRMSQVARRPVHRWRCRVCLDAGLEGRLDIVSRNGDRSIFRCEK